MRAFIYDKYGYYPLEEEATSFEYDGWYFKLELSERNDYQIHELRFLLDKINNEFYPLGCDVLLTRDNHYVSESQYGPLVLIGVKIGEVDISTLIKMHRLFFGKFMEKLTISKQRSLWLNKLENIENRIINTLPIDDKEFSNMKILGQYAIYLIENAVQYLLDTEVYFGDEIKNITLTHKRLDKLDYFYLFNPFNFLIDSPMRDFAELYKNNNIILEDLCSIISTYNISKQDASLLMARCLYPSNIVDIFEDYYELKKDVREIVKKAYLDLDNQLLKLKKIHTYLVNTYNIRPINWLK